MKGRTPLIKINRLNIITKTELDFGSDSKVIQYGDP